MLMLQIIVLILGTVSSMAYYYNGRCDREYIIGVIQKLNLSQKEINRLQQTERECRYILENTRLNLTRVEEEFRVALNEMVIVSITEQNNLWQQCVKMKGGKSCDITPGCKTRNGACFPINVEA